MELRRHELWNPCQSAEAAWCRLAAADRMAAADRGSSPSNSPADCLLKRLLPAFCHSAAAVELAMVANL